MGKLLKFIIILIAILIAIGYFSGEEVSSSDNQTSSAVPISESKEQCESGYYKNSSNAHCIKVPENALSVDESWYCKSGYYKNKTKTTCLKVPENATKYSGADAWYCNSGYLKSGEDCIKEFPEETIKQFITIDSSANTAPMRSGPGSSQTLRRVPAKTKLKVISKKIIKGATKYMPDVTWFKVNYNGATGWVSEFVTTSATF